MTKAPPDDSIPRTRRRRRRRRLRLRRIGWPLGGVAILVFGVLAALAIANLRPARGTPHGQVIAVVNGREITLQDLDAEARARHLNADRARRGALLQAVVDRALLANAARDQHLDRTESYLADKVRADEQTLADQLTATYLVTTPPTTADLQAYALAHPFAFADRKRLRLHQIAFSADEGAAGGYDALPSLAAVIDRLHAENRPYREMTASVDTAEIPDRIASALAALPPGGVLITRQAGRVVASEVVSAEAEPSTPGDQPEQARNLLQQARDALVLKARLAELRRNANIAYQPGFAPTAEERAEPQ